MATLYTNGQIALPEQLCQRLGIQDGDALDVSEEAGGILLRPVLPVDHLKKFEARIITDPVTGLPVLDAGPEAPVLTSEMVAEMLKDFP
jgi:AbrB family looped-hinge helix DNA binding protein